MTPTIGRASRRCSRRWRSSWGAVRRASRTNWGQQEPALKRLAIEAVNEFLADHRSRLASLTVRDAQEVLREGNERARDLAAATLREVRTAMGMDYSSL